MDGLRCVLLLVFGVAACFVSATAGESGHHTERFDRAFRRFLRDNGYSGGTVAAAHEGRLVLAKAYGEARDGTQVKVTSRFPVSSLSKSLTAVAVLRLVRQGLLDLDDRVFGPQGLLDGVVRPLDQATADPRLNTITVGHLLRHSAGWDPNVAPLFDPVLNEVYKGRGHSVPDIAQAMDAPSPLDALSIIRYAVSQPMHFTPGTKVVYSNLAYLILGRLVEEVAALPYEDYVKKFVLNPCGMWHTRVGAPASADFAHKLEDDVAPEDTPESEKKHPSNNKKSNKDDDVDDDIDLFEMLDPHTVDSALGWFSTVFDVARFSRCVFDGDEVLDDASLEVLLQRQDSAPVRRSDSWLCAGFRTNTRGAVWQDGDSHADDFLLHHDLLADRADDEKSPDTWVILLHGSRLHHLRHKARELMRELGDFALDLDATRNHFVADLSDVGGSRSGDGVLVKFRVDEHHLDGYVRAVREEGYNVRWVSPYTYHRHTAFVVVSRLIAGTAEPEMDFQVSHGLTEHQLLSRKLSMERHDYNLTFLQSYHSQSHASPDHLSFLAVFRRHAYPSDTQLKYGTDHLPEPYDKLVQMYQEKRFHPLVQSVLPRGADGREEEHLSFVFLQTPHSRPVDFKNYYRLPDAKLQKTIQQNAQRGRTLSFLDAYRLQKKPRFAAVFTNETRPRWHFQSGLTKRQASSLIESRLTSGLWPAIIVAYAASDEDLNFSVFLRTDEDAAPLAEPLSGDSQQPASSSQRVHYRGRKKTSAKRGHKHRKQANGN